MKETMNSLLRPKYTTRRANAPINLGRSNIQITCGARQIQCTGKARLLLQPRTHLVVTADLSSNPEMAAQLITGDPVTLKYNKEAATVKVVVLSSTSSCSADQGARTTVELQPNPQHLTICPNRRRRLQSVTFHVMNFPAFKCAGPDSTNIKYTYRSGGLRLLGRVVLRNADWTIEIQELPQAKRLVAELRDKGGFAITHVGQITRSDRTSFAISKVEKALDELRLFLSFANGLWVPVILPVGFDKNGKRLFEEWALPRSTPWQFSRSSFDRNHGEMLAELYPGFTALLLDPDMGEPLKAALYWYLMSNQGSSGIDSGLILSQAALERLATAYIKKMGLVTGSSAGDRICRAFQHSKIPITIPRASSAAYRARRRGVWKNIPEAIVKVRNELVHPETRLKVNLGALVPGIWNLAQWYIELFILRHSNFTGFYSNRIQAPWVGQ
ncbi:MAG: hypothetical protein IID51_11305, partial [Proteobacteria bacterium]|nr:hypothetical protein [Pseudomonadota bacterium]